MDRVPSDKPPVEPLRCDLNRVDVSTWPQRAFPLPRTKALHVPVVIRQSVLNAIHHHGQSQSDVEVCGVLVGNGYRGDDWPFVYIEASIRGEHAGSQLAQVTFTADTWNHIQQELDRDHPHLRIMGWYHTHPGFGVFLSAMDLFIHEHFFNSAEQLALVYDPIRCQEGVFIWREGEARPEPVLVEPDVVERDEKMTMRITFPSETTAAATVDTTPMAPQLADLRRRQRWLSAALGLVGLIAVFWPIGLQLLWPRWVSPPPSVVPSKNEAQMPSNNQRAPKMDATPREANPDSSDARESKERVGDRLDPAAPPSDPAVQPSDPAVQPGAPSSTFSSED
jgi:proteasome lid subunit RPN8/RPN11